MYRNNIVNRVNRVNNVNNDNRVNRINRVNKVHRDYSVNNVNRLFKINRYNRVYNNTTGCGSRSVFDLIPIIITILIQATQSGWSTWLLCAGWSIMRTKMSLVMIMGMRSKTDLEPHPVVLL